MNDTYDGLPLIRRSPLYLTSKTSMSVCIFAESLLSSAALHCGREYNSGMTRIHVKRTTTYFHVNEYIHYTCIIVFLYKQEV